MCAILRFFLQLCPMRASEVEVSEKVTPRSRPHTRSLVNFEGSLNRSQKVEERPSMRLD